MAPTTRSMKKKTVSAENIVSKKSASRSSEKLVDDSSILLTNHTQRSVQISGKHEAAEVNITAGLIGEPDRLNNVEHNQQVTFQSVLEESLKGTTTDRERRRIARRVKYASRLSNRQARRKYNDLKFHKKKLKEINRLIHGGVVKDRSKIMQQKTNRVTLVARLGSFLQIYERCRAIKSGLARKRKTTSSHNGSQNRHHASLPAKLSSDGNSELSIHISSEADGNDNIKSASDDVGNEEEDAAKLATPYLRHNSSNETRARAHPTKVASSHDQQIARRQISKASSPRSLIRSRETGSCSSATGLRTDHSGKVSRVSPVSGVFKLKVEPRSPTSEHTITVHQAQRVATSSFKLPDDAVHVKIEDDSEDEIPLAIPRSVTAAEQPTISLAMAGRQRAYDLNVAHEGGRVEMIEFETVLRQRDETESRLRQRIKVLTYMCHFTGISNLQIERSMSKVCQPGSWDPKIEKILGQKRKGDMKDGGPLRKKRRSQP